MADHEHKCERYCLWHVRIPWVREVVGVTGPARAVLWVLAVVYANGETGLAWPGVVTLARESGLSRWTVGRALDDLLAIGAGYDVAGKMVVPEIGLFTRRYRENFLARRIDAGLTGLKRKA